MCRDQRGNMEFTIHENEKSSRPYHLASPVYQLQQSADYWQVWDQVARTLDQIRMFLAGDVYRWHDTSQNEAPFGSRVYIEFSNPSDRILFKLSFSDELIEVNERREITKLSWP